MDDSTLTEHLQLSLTDKEPLPKVAIPTGSPIDRSKAVAPLMRLPAELHLKIMTELGQVDYLGMYTFRLCNKYFYNTISAPEHHQLLILEDLPFSLEHSLYTCRYCLRLRHASQFADKMLRGKTGRDGGDTGKRFCADCGFDTSKPQRYMRGTQLKINGELWLRCFHCDRVKKGSKFR